MRGAGAAACRTGTQRAIVAWKTSPLAARSAAPRQQLLHRGSMLWWQPGVIVELAASIAVTFVSPTMPCLAAT